MRFGSEVLKQRRREPRFTNTCLAGKEHHLTFAGLCL